MTLKLTDHIEELVKETSDAINKFVSRLGANSSNEIENNEHCLILRFDFKKTLPSIVENKNTVMFAEFLNTVKRDTNSSYRINTNDRTVDGFFFKIQYEKIEEDMLIIKSIVGLHTFNL